MFENHFRGHHFIYLKYMVCPELTFSAADMLIGSGNRTPFSRSLALAAVQLILFQRICARSRWFNSILIKALTRGKTYDWSTVVSLAASNNKSPQTSDFSVFSILRTFFFQPILNYQAKKFFFQNLSVIL